MNTEILPYHMIPSQKKSEIVKKSGNTFQYERNYPNEAANHDLNKILERLAMDSELPVNQRNVTMVDDKI